MILLKTKIKLQSRQEKKEASKNKSDVKHPLLKRPTTYEEFNKTYALYLDPDALNKYKHAIEIIFRSDFYSPPKHHTEEMIFGGFQCLYTKIRDGFEDTQKREKIMKQLSIVGWHFINQLSNSG